MTTTGLMGWINPKGLNIPQTGDNASGLWMFTLCAALVAAASLTLLKKKQDGGSFGTPA